MKLLLLALASAIVFPLALPNELLPFGSPLLGLVSLTPLYVAFVLSPSRVQAVRIGILFGAVSTLIGNYWLANFGEFSVWTLGGPVVGYIGYNALLAVVIHTVVRSRDEARPLLFAIAWTGYEFLKSVGYLGYPWGLAAYPFAEVRAIAQISDITGVYGITFIAVYAQAAIGEMLISHRGNSAVPWRTHIALAVALFVPVLAYGLVRGNEERTEVSRVRAVLVQQNTDSWLIGNEEETIRQLIQLSEEGLAERQVDLLVWSETSLRIPYADYRDTYYDRTPRERSLRAFLQDTGIPLLTGTPYYPDDGSGMAWNAALLVLPDGEVSHAYGKQQLVPFVESVPFWESKLVQGFYRNVIGIQAVWKPGTTPTLFPIETDEGTVLAATPICFEDAFAGVVRGFDREGAQILINLTNNAWSETNSAQTQHFTAARFRSIETRLPLIRSTNAGLTSVVDPWGDVTDYLPMFESRSLYVDVPIYERRRRTVYSTVGDAFAVLTLLLTAFAVGNAAAANARSGQHPQRPASKLV